MTFKIGIDFDNTIVDYDQLFYHLALEQKHIPQDLPANKTSVRDHLRKNGLEDTWIHMQGLAYGREIERAQVFPGVKEFLSDCRDAGILVYIISHKTKHPFRGEPFDLHEAALRFLHTHGFFDESFGLDLSRVFLEFTKEEKAKRIAALDCDEFIDDLPEFLRLDEFPNRCNKVLFDPNAQWGESDEEFDRVQSWKSMRVRLKAVIDIRDSLTTMAAPFSRISLKQLSEGKNNRVFCAKVNDHSQLYLKEYFSDPQRSRNRKKAEVDFLKYAGKREVACVPTLFSEAEKFVVFKKVPGEKIKHFENRVELIDAAIDFLVQLNRERPDLDSFSPASDACLVIPTHMRAIDERLNRLSQAKVEGINGVNLRIFLNQRLIPSWQSYKAWFADMRIKFGLSDSLQQENWILSPSDFGFHNALVDDKTVYFLDFEYSGWDDPSKAVGDFICQPEITIPARHLDHAINRLSQSGILNDPKGFVARTNLMVPTYCVKWTCIVLNEFLDAEVGRRNFANGTFNQGLLARQLDKASAYFVSFDSFLERAKSFAALSY